jgi:hypothetical protein
LPSCSHRLLLATVENLLEQLRRQFLAFYISPPTAACLTSLDLSPSSGLDESFSISQLLDQSRILDFFLELAHGFFHIAILYHN